VTEQPATAEEAWAKIIRIAHRGVSSKKKISATRKLHLSIKPLLHIHITFASEEIIRCPTSYIWLSPSWGWLKLDESMLPAIIHF
jgi:hypothetical protein